MTAYTPIEAPAAEALRVEPRRESNFTGQVIIPLIQNLMGGLAVAGALLTVLAGIYLYSGWWDDRAGLSALCVGALVLCVATFIRFFADDFGLLKKAYQAGADQAEGRIDTLNRELDNERKEHAQTEYYLRAANQELGGRNHKHISDLHPAGARDRAAVAIEYWFDNQKWLTRDVAMDKQGGFKWTKGEWEDVQDLLGRAKLSKAAGTSMALTVQNMDVAWHMLRMYFGDTLAAPAVDATPSGFVSPATPPPPQNGFGGVGRTDGPSSTYETRTNRAEVGEGWRGRISEAATLVAIAGGAAVVLFALTRL